MNVLFFGDPGPAGNNLRALCSAAGFGCASATAPDNVLPSLDEPAACVFTDAAFLEFSRNGPVALSSPILVLLEEQPSRAVVVDRIKRGAANCLGPGEWNELPPLLREEIESFQNERTGPALERKVAAERLRLLGRLAVGAVHEVNNSLTAILNFATVLARTPGAREREIGESIQTECRRIAELAGMVQYLVKGGGTAPAVTRASFLQEFERMAARFLKRDRISFELPGEMSELPDLRGVRTELEFVLYLLVCQIAVNVRRAPGGGWHTIRFSMAPWTVQAGVRIGLETPLPRNFEPEPGVDELVSALMRKNGGAYARESGGGEERFFLYIKSAAESAG